MEHAVMPSRTLDSPNHSRSGIQCIGYHLPSREFNHFWSRSMSDMTFRERTRQHSPFFFFISSNQDLNRKYTGKAERPATQLDVRRSFGQWKRNIVSVLISTISSWCLIETQEKWRKKGLMFHIKLYDEDREKEKLQQYK